MPGSGTAVICPGGGIAPESNEKEVPMGRKPRAALLSLAAASLVALMIDYLQTELSRSSS